MVTNNLRIDINIIEVNCADGKDRLVYPEIKIDVDVDSGYDITKLRNFKHQLSEFISVKLSDAIIKE